MSTGSSKKSKNVQGPKTPQGVKETQSPKHPPAPVVAPAAPEKRGVIGKLLDGVEKVGNKVPHPVLMFLYLIAFIIVLSHILYMLGVSVTSEVLEPVPVAMQPNYYEDTSLPPLEIPVGDYGDQFEIREETIPIQSLLTMEGIRFIFTSFVSNFAGFTVVATIFVAMLGVGVAEEAGMMAALIRKLVKVAPARLITFIIVFIGGLSSVATDAGYLILIPLGAAAFLSLNRHPIAGLVAAFAGVSVAFAVNILIAPLDALLTEMTNEAYQLVNPGASISITANLYFNIVSTIFFAVVVTIITERLIEPRLGKFVPNPADAKTGGAVAAHEEKVDLVAEGRGLKHALYWFLGALAFILLLTLPPGAPLRRPEGVDAGSPLLDSLIFIITLLFLFAGIGYGRGAGTIKSSNDVIAGVTKTFAGLASLIFLLLIISQFIGLFNYTNMPQVLAVAMAGVLEQMNIGPIPLLVGMILVIFLLDFIIPGSMPKWAIFAPVFVPLFVQLGVAPQTVLAAYRIGDSPANVITPLMVYFPFIVLVAQRYDKNAGIGTIISLMLPYTLIVLVVWIIFFVIWFLLGIPLGPGYPVSA
jgi:aminobenzoyl-glutamate transport protein